MYSTLHIREKAKITNCSFLLLSDYYIPVLSLHNCSAKIEISHNFLWSIKKSIKVQELIDSDIVLIDKFNLTYNPFSGKLEEGW